MEPNSFGNQMPQPQPVVAPQGPVPETKKSKKGLIVGLIIGGILLVAVVVILIFKFVRPNYRAAYEQATELYNDISYFMYNSNCKTVKTDVEKLVNADTYAGYIEGCKTDAAEIYEKIKQFGELGTVKNDADVKVAFEKFKEAFDNDAPGQEKLDGTLEIYGLVHKFVLAQENFNFNNSTDLPAIENFYKITDDLAFCDNQDIKTLAEGINQGYNVLYDTWSSYVNARNVYESTGGGYDTYQAALRNYQETKEKFVKYIRINLDDYESTRLVYDNYGNGGGIIGNFENVRIVLNQK